MTPRVAAAGVSFVTLLLLLLAPSFTQAAFAATFVGGTSDWTPVGAPVVTNLGFSEAAETTFQNNLDVSVLGIVVMVLHNDRGQTVYYSTATLNITRGLYATAYTVESGVSPGVYNATVFAISTGGIAISNPTTISFAAR